MNNNSWPRLRAILDEAIATEFGIIVEYSSWVEAETVRANAYKIRDALRRKSRSDYPDIDDPRHGVSIYDGLIFWLRPQISRKQMTVIFADGDRPYLPDDPRGKHTEDENLFPGERVTLILADGAKVENAPSFKEAWKILRVDYPCDLVIENGYNLGKLKIKAI